jgi:hypothetical protein
MVGLAPPASQRMASAIMPSGGKRGQHADPHGDQSVLSIHSDHDSAHGALAPLRVLVVVEALKVRPYTITRDLWTG